MKLLWRPNWRNLLTHVSGDRSKSSEGSLGPSLRGDRAFKILAIADAAGATLQINLLRPLAAAARAGDVKVRVFTEKNEGSALDATRDREMVETLFAKEAWDLIFVSRYGSRLASHILEVAARRAIPLIFHIDDNLFEVPAEAGAAKAKKHASVERQKSLKSFLERADLVYLSTAPLAEQLRDHAALRDNVFIGQIASASDAIVRPSVDRRLRRRFGYMASSGHAPDLALAMPGIEAALSAEPSLEFVIFGSLVPPIDLARFGRRVSHVPATAQYDKFLSKLSRLDWDWGIAPLRAGRFNEAKTDTKWVEYAAAGIPCLVSDHPLYEACSSDGAAVRVADHEWKSLLPRALMDARLAGQTRENALRRLQSRHSLEKMALQLGEAFDRAGVKRRPNLIGRQES